MGATRTAIRNARFRLGERWRGPVEGPRYVCCGLNKSATSSVRGAMTRLGLGPTTRESDKVDRRRIFDAIVERGDYGPAIARARYYQVFKDRPWNVRHVHRALDQAFPGSFFVLSVRDPEIWWRSVESWLISHPKRREMYTRHLDVAEIERSACIEAYARHNDEIRRYFAGTGRLLEMNLERGDGWTELCGFLGLPIPDQPFPHLNHQRYADAPGADAPEASPAPTRAPSP